MAVINGFKRCWENSLHGRIKNRQPSTNAGTQVTDSALGKSLKQIKFISSTLTWVCCIFQCKTFLLHVCPLALAGHPSLGMVAVP